MESNCLHGGKFTFSGQKKRVGLLFACIKYLKIRGFFIHRSITSWRLSKTKMNLLDNFSDQNFLPISMLANVDKIMEQIALWTVMCVSIQIFSTDSICVFFLVEKYFKGETKISSLIQNLTQKNSKNPTDPGLRTGLYKSFWRYQKKVKLPMVA